MVLDEAPGNASGVIVSQVQFGSAAEEAGIVRGDWILEVDRKPVHSIEDFQAIVKEARSYLLRVRRTSGDGSSDTGYTIVVLDLRRGARR
jgi:S1-C subfamily serine protease